MRRPIPVVSVLLMTCMVVAGAACGRDKVHTAGAVTMAGETVTVVKLRWISSGLCDAAELAGDNLNSARATFYGQSHDGIHLIARGLEAVDRRQAASLLEAKQKVEADFVDPPSGPQVADDLRHLADVTRSSLVRFNVSVDPCS